MGRAPTAGAPSPHHFHHPTPATSPPPATAFPPKGNNISHQQQQGYDNVITTPQPQYQQNIPIPTQQHQHQQNNVNGHVMNNDIMRPQPQNHQQMGFQQNQAIGVPFQVNGGGVNGKVGSTNGNGNAMVNPWTTGLFDCMDDPTTALITAFFPCITFGQIADVLDNGHTNCTTSGIIYAVAPCIVSRAYRKKLRQRFGLVEAPASDWIVHSMFEYCAICQEHRELTNRGINPALGYRGNLNNNQNQQNITMMPPNNQIMG